MSFSIISKYRSELMGYAIIGVLIGHIIVFGEIHESGLISVISWLSLLIHTKGFLFLSGFGVFYSMNKDSNAWHFYIRRFYKFLLPFLVVAMPYFLVVTLANDGNFMYYLGKITTIDFWIFGNYHGMWYVAVLLVLYIITPPIYYWLIVDYKFLWVKVLFLLLIVFSINELISFSNPEYWSLVKIGLSQIPCFFIGILFAYLSINISDRHLFCVVLLLLVILYIISIIWDVVPGDYCSPLIWIPCFILLFSLFFMWTDSASCLRWINYLYRWFGKYTFELYILHIYLWFIIKEVCHLSALWNIILAVFLAIIFAIPMRWATNKVSSWMLGTINKSNS